MMVKETNRVLHPVGLFNSDDRQNGGGRDQQGVGSDDRENDGGRD